MNMVPARPFVMFHCETARGLISLAFGSSFSNVLSSASEVLW